MSCVAGFFVRSGDDLVQRLDIRHQSRAASADRSTERCTTAAEGHNLSIHRPLENGRGANGHLIGRLSDGRLFGKALSQDDIQRQIKE